jgi:hypothetical protein
MKSPDDNSVTVNMSQLKTDYLQDLANCYNYQLNFCGVLGLEEASLSSMLLQGPNHSNYSIIFSQKLRVLHYE